MLATWWYINKKTSKALSQIDNSPLFTMYENFKRMQYEWINDRKDEAEPSEHRIGLYSIYRIISHGSKYLKSYQINLIWIQWQLVIVHVIILSLWQHVHWPTHILFTDHLMPITHKNSKTWPKSQVPIWLATTASVKKFKKNWCTCNYKILL